jgi:hypothetical protein
MLERPDDPVAWKLLNAAGDALGRGNLRQGVNIRVRPRLLRFYALSPTRSGLVIPQLA